jgi:hypothetical protein
LQQEGFWGVSQPALSSLRMGSKEKFCGLLYVMTVRRWRMCPVEAFRLQSFEKERVTKRPALFF